MGEMIQDRPSSSNKKLTLVQPRYLCNTVQWNASKTNTHSDYSKQYWDKSSVWSFKVLVCYAECIKMQVPPLQGQVVQKLANANPGLYIS